MSAQGEDKGTLTSPLRGEVAAQRRVRGTKPSKLAVVRARSLRQSGTDAEQVLWHMLRNRQIDGQKFVRQYPVGPYIADFACREAMLIIELDGDQHAENSADEARTRYLNANGYSVLRIWNNELLENRDGCWDAIHSVLVKDPSPDLRFAAATLSPKGRGEAAPPDSSIDRNPA